MNSELYVSRAMLGAVALLILLWEEKISSENDVYVALQSLREELVIYRDRIEQQQLGLK